MGFAFPQIGVKTCTMLSGVALALVIIHSSALVPHLAVVSYLMTGLVAFSFAMKSSGMWLAQRSNRKSTTASVSQ